MCICVSVCVCVRERVCFWLSVFVWVELDQLSYLDRNISSGGSDASTRLRFSINWKSDATDKIKRIFFPTSWHVGTTIWLDVNIWVWNWYQLSLSLSLSLYIYIYIYICICIYCHPQTDCFVLSQLFSMAIHARCFKLWLQHSLTLRQSDILPQRYRHSLHLWMNF